MDSYIVSDRAASVADLRSQLSSYLSAVKAGEEILITERGRPIARLVPIRGESAEEGRVGELVRAGQVREPEVPFPADFLDLPRPADPRGEGVRAILEERAEGP